jgi:succinate dehydrogenase/fumarate reductase flavoprotein subunit
MGEDISRRGFLKGAGVGALGVLGAGTLTACASQDGIGDEKPNSGSGSSVSDFDEEFDVIVVGAGIAGLASSITVVNEGDGVQCLLLEKDIMPNGNSPFAAGYMTYVNDSDAALEYLEQLTGEYTPRDVLKAFADGLKDNRDWLRSLGAADDDLIVTEPKGAVPGSEYPEMTNGGTCGLVRFNPEGSGPGHIQPFLMDVMRSLSDRIDYRPSTPLESLIQDSETRAILGVVANSRRFKANKGVIMCTGGFENDPEMMFNYTGVVGAKPYAGLANTGDGHRAAMAVGADFWHMHGGAQFWMACRDLKNESFISVLFNYANKQHGITVGLHGRRYYQDFDCCYTAATPGVSQVTSRDDTSVGFAQKTDYRHGITQWGGNWTHLPFPEKSWYIYDSEGLAAGAIPESLSKDPVADGWALSATSIEELASKIEVPVEELVNTVRIWNGFCDDGTDKAFYRPADTMRRIETGSFYATLCVPALLNTDGGPVRSAWAEILDPFGKPIDGLYSAGEFGSVWGHLYNGAGNIAECAVFGRIAARSVLTR